MTPIDDPCPCNTTGCEGVQPHSVTGWCSTEGVPVIVIYTLACTSPAATGPDVVGIYDAETGVPVVGPIRPCGERDWEVAQWCDVDAEGAIITAYIVAFVWDEVTQTLTATTTLPDGVTPYVPTGTAHQCDILVRSTDVEPICYDVEGTPTPGWVLLVINPTTELIDTEVYYNQDFSAVLVAPTVVSCTETVEVTNFPASVEISNDVGNPVPVSGPLTDAELRATPVPVSGTVTASPEDSGTTVHTNVASSATNVTLLAANAARTGATIFNDSTEDLYLKLGATASTTSFTIRMPPAAAPNSMSYYELPFGYTGIIDGLWAAANGFARVVEFTA